MMHRVRAVLDPLHEAVVAPLRRPVLRALLSLARPIFDLLFKRLVVQTCKQCRQLLASLHGCWVLSIPGPGIPGGWAALELEIDAVRLPVRLVVPVALPWLPGAAPVKNEGVLQNLVLQIGYPPQACSVPSRIQWYGMVVERQNKAWLVHSLNPELVPPIRLHKPYYAVLNVSLLVSQEVNSIDPGVDVARPPLHSSAHQGRREVEPLVHPRLAGRRCGEEPLICEVDAAHEVNKVSLHNSINVQIYQLLDPKRQQEIISEVSCKVA
mmetsp:Transcript_15800/g.44206  ORF Transcript_15800/g.44206 Transcript_15800/m.44206 type:complete len:267 (-) Transcript_15800:668-1468(-)